MNSKTVRELRIISRDKDLHGCYKLKKAGLVAFLLEQSTEEMLTLPLTTRRTERRPAHPIKIISSLQEMGEFEKEEMEKSRPVVKNRLNQWCDWLVDYVPKPIKNAVGKAFSRAKNSILGLYDGAKKSLKDYMESETEKENQEQEEDVDLTQHEHKRALKGNH